MATVILPTQLSAQMLPSGDGAIPDAVQEGLSASGQLPLFFAALLAEQLGATGLGKRGEDSDLVDIKQDCSQDQPLFAASDSNLVDTLTQMQQSLMGAPTAQFSAAVPADAARENASVQMASVQPAAGRLAQPGFQLAEDAGVARQALAVSTASFADAEAQVAFAGQAESLAEQTIRPVANTVSPATPAAVAGAIAQPVSSPAWDGALGDRVLWMVGQQQQSAELRLNPPSLGPLEIKLNLSDGQATLTFSTQHLPVKEALEAATPRLREMLGESGISLGNVSVNVGTSAQQQQNEAQHANRQNAEWEQKSSDHEFASALPVAATTLSRGGDGMVDFFA